jgi:hypothetical protein
VELMRGITAAMLLLLLAVAARADDMPLMGVATGKSSGASPPTSCPLSITGGAFSITGGAMSVTC